MSYPRKITNFNVFVDGFGYAGIATEATLPELMLDTEEHRGAGMDGSIPIDMGLQAMEAELKFAEFMPEIIKQFGFKRRATLRAGAKGEDDFSADAWAFVLGGRVVGVPMDPLKLKSEVNLMEKWGLDYFRVEKNREVLIEVDVLNGKRVVGGVDQMAEMRAAIGI